MTDKRVFSRRIIWSEEDISDLSERIGNISNDKQLSDYDIEAGNQLGDVPGDSTPPIPVDPVPPTPPTPTLPYPWPITLKSSTVKNDALGNPTADVIITFPDVTGAEKYEVRLTKL